MSRKYLAFRIDDRNIVNHATVDGFFVRGYAEGAPNWPLLREESFDSLDDAVTYIRGLPAFHGQPLYGPDGVRIS